MASARHTQNHEEIRKWVAARGGHPAQVEGTGGVLRIDFGKPSDTEFLYDPEGHMNTFARSGG